MTTNCQLSSASETSEPPGGCTGTGRRSGATVSIVRNGSAGVVGSPGLAEPRDRAVVPVIWVGATEPGSGLRELLAERGRLLIVTPGGSRLARDLEGHDRAVVCFGRRVPGRRLAAALDALAAEAPKLACAVLVLGAPEEPEALQPLIDADRIFFLVPAPPPARDLAALIESAAESLAEPQEGSPDPLDAGTLRRLAHAGSATELAVDLAPVIARATAAETGRLVLLDRTHRALWLPERDDGELHTTASGVGGFIVRTGLALRLPRVGDDPRFDPDLDAPHGGSTDRFLGVPVHAGDGRTVAVLAALRPPEEAPFEPREVTALEALASRVAPYVETWVDDPRGARDDAAAPDRAARRPRGPFRRRALRELDRPSGGDARPLRAIVGRRRRIRYVSQSAAADCGAACLAMTLGHHGKVVSLEDVRRVTGSARHGLDASTLVRAGGYFGLRGRGVQLQDLAELPLLEPGSILHWGFKHFVVLERVERRGAWILDPGYGRRFAGSDELDRAFTGVALTFEPGPDFEPGGERASLLGRYLRRVLRHNTALGRVLLASLVLQVCSLALPILTGVVVDRVIPGRDHRLFSLLILGATAFAGFNLLTSLLRARTLLAVRTRLDKRLALDFLEHMVRLPFLFFQQRSSGDLLMRLRSNATIREILTSSVLSGALDGLMVVSYLVLLLASDVRLGLVVAGLAAVRIVILLAAARRRRRLTSEALETQAASQSYQVQLLAGIEALKACGAEGRAVETWSNLFVRELNASLSRDRLDALVNSLLAGLTLASPLAVLLYGATRVMAGDLTLGVMLSLAALAAGFLAPISTLVSQASQFQLLGSYFERLDDVLSTPAEPDGLDLPAPACFTGGLELRGVSFSYGPLVPPALEGISLQIEPGQLVAVVGPSGSGKSTLAGVLAGLLDPDAGEVLYDGRRRDQVPREWLRERMAYVPQQSFLFPSSIRANISLRDPTLPLERIVEAASRAEIHEEVAALPMSYETVLADGGSSLSGGQRQRIALARALVGRPSVLILDEATSALDAVTEQRVQENLQQLRITRIVAAHRLSTIRAADRIVVLDRGRIVDAGTHDQLAGRPGLYRQLIDAQLEGVAQPGPGAPTAQPGKGPHEPVPTSTAAQRPFPVAAPHHS